MFIIGCTGDAVAASLTIDLESERFSIIYLTNVPSHASIREFRSHHIRYIIQISSTRDPDNKIPRKALLTTHLVSGPRLFLRVAGRCYRSCPPSSRGGDWSCGVWLVL